MPNRYILFYKPYDVLSTFTDPEGRPTLGTYVTAPGVYAAGRLDQDSEGLMLLTDDGRLAHVLTDPDHKLPKTYFVQVENEPDKAAISQLRRGMVIKGETTLPAEVDLLDEEPDLPPRSVPIRYRPSIPTRWLRVVLREGRKRQIRHMTAAVGHPTLRLIRVAIGPLTLRGLQPGQWRDLTPEELEALRGALGLRQPGSSMTQGARARGEEPRQGATGPQRQSAGAPRGPRQETPRGRSADERGPRSDRGGSGRPARTPGGGRGDDRDRPLRRTDQEQGGPPRTSRGAESEARQPGPRAGRGPQPPRPDEGDNAPRGGKRWGSRPPVNRGQPAEGGRQGNRGPSSGEPRPERRGPRPAGQQEKRPEARRDKQTGPQRSERRPEPRREERPEPQRQERRPEPRREERPEPPRRERAPETSGAGRSPMRIPGGGRTVGQTPKRRTS